MFIGNVLRTSVSGHLEWITICCHSRPDAPHIESSVDLGIVWEVESGGGRGTGDLWEFREVQIKDLTTPALSLSLSLFLSVSLSLSLSLLLVMHRLVFTFTAQQEKKVIQKKKKCGNEKEWDESVRDRHIQQRRRDRQLLHQWHGPLLGHTLNQRQMFPFPLTKPHQLSLPLFPSALPNYFSKKGQTKNQLSVNMQTPQIP